MPRFTVVVMSIALVGCAADQSALIHEPLPAAEGTAVPLGKAVEVGNIAVEPLRVIEDSRCPADVTCVWQGRLVIEANIAGYPSAEIARLTLGESHTALGLTFRFAAATPATNSRESIRSPDYRFTFVAE
jgi:hypothetical protein